jgi:pimeloyl-ACP methyl ester carboxylesterase
VLAETGGAVRDAIFLSTQALKLMQFVMERLPRAFLTRTLARIGHLPMHERKRYASRVLNSPEAVASVNGIMDTPYPYSRRAQGTRNDSQQGRAMTRLPPGKITGPTLIIHGTHDADATFCDGVRARGHIKGAQRYRLEGRVHLALAQPRRPKAGTCPRLLERTRKRLILAKACWLSVAGAAGAGCRRAGRRLTQDSLVLRATPGA